MIRRMVEQSRRLRRYLSCVVYRDRPVLTPPATRTGFQPGTRFTFHILKN